MNCPIGFQVPFAEYTGLAKCPVFYLSNSVHGRTNLKVIAGLHFH